MGVFPKASPGL
jgi:hypothetical protein